MTAFFEDPLPLIYVGVIVESILVALFYGTQKKVWLYPIVGALLLVIALVLVERLVVTDREAVENTIDTITAALIANDVDAVLAHLSDSAHESRACARAALERIKVSGAKVSGLEITVDSLAAPPSAKASFFGVVKFEDRKKEYPYQVYSAELEVEFRKEGGRWMLMRHRELPGH